MFDDRVTLEPPWRPGPKGWLFLLVFWTLPLALILGLQAARSGAEALPPWRYLTPQLAGWLAWAAAPPLVVTLGRRFPLSARRAFRRVAAQVMVSAAVAGAMGLPLRPPGERR